MIPELAVCMVVGLSFYAYPIQSVLFAALYIAYRSMHFAGIISKFIKNIVTKTFDVESASDFLSLNSVLNELNTLKPEEELRKCKYSKLSQETSDLLNAVLRITFKDPGFVKRNVVAFAIASLIKSVDIEKIITGKYGTFASSLFIPIMMKAISDGLILKHKNKDEPKSNDNDNEPDFMYPLHRQSKPIPDDKDESELDDTSADPALVRPVMPTDFVLDDLAERDEDGDLVEEAVVEDVIVNGPIGVITPIPAGVIPIPANPDDEVTPGGPVVSNSELLIESEQDKIKRLEEEIKRIRARSN